MWFLSSTALWAMTGAGLAVMCEYLYRVVHKPWHEMLWLWMPLQTFIGYTVYRLVTMPHTTLIDAFIYWSFSTVAARVFVTLALLHDPVSTGTWVALGLLICARCAQQFIR